MKPSGAPVSFHEAISLVDANIQPIDRTELVRLDDSIGRVLAADLKAKASVARREDIKEGTLLLENGSVIDAGRIGVLASQGLKKVEVYQRPTAAVIPSGKEIVSVGRRLKSGQIYDINSHTVSAVVGDNGAEAYIFGVMGDRADVIRGTVAEALKFDLVVISGSVGEPDLLPGILGGWGQVLFRGVNMTLADSPFFATIEGKPLIRLPGHPTSCLIDAYLFVLPAVRKMAHLPPGTAQTISVPLGHKVEGSIGRRQFLTVKIVNGKAVSVFKESGIITGIANADGYIEIPENAGTLPKGATVTVTLF